MKKEKLLNFKPTQLAIGMLEVKDKLKELSRMNRAKLEKEVRENPLEAVRSPNKDIYIVDGHHRAMAYWLFGLRKAPYVILYRFPKRASCKIFWKMMYKKHWAHPYDQSGDGPRDPVYFNQDIRGIGNDPYRSLAWLVREAGGYKKTDETFADFKWADFFRKRKLLICSYEPDFHQALPKALKLAHSKKARHLPGYNQKPTAEKVAMRKKK